MKFNSYSLPLTILILVFLVPTVQKKAAAQPTSSKPEAAANLQNSEKSIECEKSREKAIYLSPQKIDDFIKQLNILGKCGYVLDKVSKLDLGTEAAFYELKVFGTVKLDPPNTYEYEWFEAMSPGQVVTRSNYRAAKGFYFRKNLIFLTGRCGRAAEKREKETGDAADLLDIFGEGSAGSGSVFIFERKNGKIKKNDYRVVNGADEREAKALAQNQKTLDEYVMRGFRPVGIYYLGKFDVFAIIMEKDETIPPQGEYLILRQHFGFNKKLTEMTRSGYSPLIVGFSFAILHRQNSLPTGFAYQSEVTPYLVEKEFRKWKNPRYLVAGLSGQINGCDLSESHLFFSVSTNAPKRYDYKFLQMTNVVERITKKKEKNATFSDPPSPQTLSEFKSLIEKGYSIRDVIYANEIFIIFERAN